jgi:Protein of unknown function (DUF1442)
MKLVWCPEMASKAYIEGVKTLAGENQHHEETDVAEFISAMAGGWKAQLIIDAQSNSADIPTSTSLALMTAAQHTRGNYIPLSEDESKAKDAMRQLKGVDYLVLDGKRRDVVSVVKEARPGPRGMVVVRYNARKNNVVSAAVFSAGMRVVRSVFLPIGEGVEVVHVGVGKGPSLGKSGRSRWIRHIDEGTGEEHLFRR